MHRTRWTMPYTETTAKQRRKGYSKHTSSGHTHIHTWPLRCVCDARETTEGTSPAQRKHIEEWDKSHRRRRRSLRRRSRHQVALAKYHFGAAIANATHYFLCFTTHNIAAAAAPTTISRRKSPSHSRLIHASANANSHSSISEWAEVAVKRGANTHVKVTRSRTVFVPYTNARVRMSMRRRSERILPSLTDPAGPLWRVFVQRRLCIQNIRLVLTERT